MAADTDTHELAAAYALDALDAHERRAFEQHLAGCARCQAEVASFGDAVLALADGATDAALAGVPCDPPAGLRERVLAAARAEGPGAFPLAAARERRERRAALAALARPQVLLPALGAAAAAAVALGVWGSSVSGSLDRERAARRSDAAALAAFSDPSAKRMAHDNASLAVAASGTGALSLADLKPAPAGKVYQAWVIPPGGKPIPAGTFDARAGKAVIVLQHDVMAGSTIAITLEPAGGSEQPTSTPLMAIDTSQA